MSTKLKAFIGLFIVTLVTSFTGVSGAFAKDPTLQSLIVRTQKITQASDKAENFNPRKKIFIHQQMLKGVLLVSKLEGGQKTIQFSKLVMKIMKNHVQDELARSRYMYQVSGWLLSEFGPNNFYDRVQKSDWADLVQTNKSLKSASTTNFSNYQRTKINLLAQKTIEGLLVDLDHYSHRMAGL